MTAPRNLPRPAEPRDVGASCPHCERLVESFDRVVACSECGAVHHEACWLGHDGCGTYECAPARRILSPGEQAGIRITAGELDAAVPLRRPARLSAVGHSPIDYSPRAGVATPGTRNKLAIASLLVGLAGLAMTGATAVGHLVGKEGGWIGWMFLASIVSGIVAALTGAIALGQVQKSGQRGAVWGTAAILFGLSATVVSIILMAFALPKAAQSAVSLDDFQMDPAVLDGVQPHIARAMRANVLVESSLSLIGQAIGSGVIVSKKASETLIVTNRHVVDAEFRDRESSSELPGTKLTVRAIGQLPVAGRVVWVAPDGIDIAVISAPLHSSDAQSAAWREDLHPAMGDEVFSIGNPQGLGWSHTKGTVSQLRTRQYGLRQVTMIQTDTAINQGNSGGGLYDEAGNLIGINTWTNDKRMSEGLSFAISLASIVQLDPPFLPDP